MPVIFFKYLQSTRLFGINRCFTPVLLVRAAALLMLAIIACGSVYGRRIQRSYEYLVEFLPYAALVVVLLGLLVIIRVGILWARRNRVNLNKVVLVGPALFALGTLSLLFIVAGELVLYPIEGVHLFKYAVLAFLLHFSQNREGNLRRALIAFLLSGTVGSIEETSQLWIPERFFDWRDILLNLIGAGTGALYSWAAGTWLAHVASRTQQDA